MGPRLEEPGGRHQLPILAEAILAHDARAVSVGDFEASVKRQPQAAAEDIEEDSPRTAVGG